MEHKGLTQLAVSERLECGSGTISKLLSGKMEMTLYWLEGFALALGVDPIDLFRDPNAPSQFDLLRGETPAKQAEIIRVIKALKAG